MKTVEQCVVFASGTYLKTVLPDSLYGGDEEAILAHVARRRAEPYSAYSPAYVMDLIRDEAYALKDWLYE